MEDPKSSQGEDRERESPHRIQYSLEEANAVLAGHSLSSMQFGAYLVIFKGEFDMIIAAEPYHALSFLLDMNSGVFLARIWNKTVRSGNAGSVEELDEACAHHFRERRLCLGLFEDEGDHAGVQFLTWQTPVPRKVSRTCLGSLSEEASLDEHTCQECLKMGPHSQKETAIKLESTEDPKLEDAIDDYENDSVDVSSHLQTVVEEMESDESPFECSDCNSCFKTPEDLLEHTNTHLNSEPNQIRPKNKKHKYKEKQHK